MYTIRPLYTDGDRTSPILRDLIGDEITINPNFIRNRLIFGNGDRRRSWSMVEHETPFKEINIVPYEEAFESHEEALHFQGDTRRSVDIEAYLERFEEVVNSSWDSSKFNLIYHSSGYDSRLVGHFVRKEYEKNPGRVLFVCWGAECEAFKHIMEYHGWDETQYTTIPPDVEECMYPFEFADVWKHVNGGSWHFSASMYHTVLDVLQKTGRVPYNDVIIWTGLNNNELIKWPGSLDGNYKSLYYSWALRMWGVIGGKDTIQPCLDIKVGKVLFDAVNRKDKVRRQSVELADPELGSFPRTTTSKLMVPLDSLKQMVADFKESYYYQNIDESIDPDFQTDILMHDGRCRRYHIFWRKWTLASLVDELVSRGVRILHE